MLTITCGKCKTTNDFESFIRGMPEKHFKCPTCKHGWKIVDELPVKLVNGFIVLGKRRVVAL